MNLNRFAVRLAPRLLLPALCCLILAAPSRAQRLGDNVRPEHYTITLAPDLKAATFTGSETIDVALAQPARAITLNAIEINSSQ